MSGYWPFERSSPYDDYFRQYGQQYNVDPILLRLMARQESMFDPQALSHKGARGLFQVMPETAKGMGIDPSLLNDPRVSTEAGARYLAEQLKAHKGDVKLALASYNAGPGTVRRYGGIPPYRETQQYVDKISGEYDRLRRGPEERLAELVGSVGVGSQASPQQRLDALLREKQQAGNPADRLEALVASKSQSPAASPEPGSEYFNPYPKGSKQWSQSVLAQGGLPAIKPTSHQKASPLPGSVFPEQESPGKTPFRPFDETYPVQYKARVVRVKDADTVEVAEVGTNRVHTIRLPDVNTPETETEDGRPNPEGIYARDYVANMLQPGDQLTIETKAGDWRGVYDRPLGKVYWNDEQGNTIDLSTPFLPTDERVVKSSDPLGDSGTGALKGIGASALQDAVEIGQMYWTARDLIDLIDGDEEYDPYLESKLYRGLEDFRKRLGNIQADWVAGGYDPDAKVHDIPGLGRLTTEEVFKAGLTASAYTIGMIPIASSLAKSLKGVALASSARMGYNAARKSIETARQLQQQTYRAKEVLKKQVNTSEELAEAGQKYLDGAHDALEQTAQVMHTAVDMDPNMTAVERIKLFKDMFLLHWRSKTDPIERLAKFTERQPELRHLLNQTRAAADVAKSPIIDGVNIWEKVPGGMKMKTINESLQAIWGGTRGIDMHLGMSWMVADRYIELYNVQNKLVNGFLSRMRTPKYSKGPRKGLTRKGLIAKQRKKAELQAKAKAEAQGMRWVDITDDALKQHIKRKLTIERIYKGLDLRDTLGNKIGNHWDGAIRQTPAGQYGVGGMLERLERTRKWSIAATMEQLIDVGAKTRKEVDRILEINQHHVPWHRTSLGVLEDVLDDDTIRAVLFTENEMLMQGKKHASLMGRGLSERSIAGVPLGKLKQGLTPGDIEDLIIDPIQTYVTRTTALTKWANQQRVRNTMGEMLDEILGKVDNPLHGWAAKTVRRTTDPKMIEKLKRSGTSAAGFVRYEKGKAIGYIVNDPALAEAIRHLDPAHMSLFKAMTQSGVGRMFMKPTDIFRKGTVLGLHFMARNPMRDQFMAATLTKYGYTPVVDWWKGLMHVITRSPLYEQARMAGGTQATHTAASFDEMQATVTDVQTGEHLTQFLRRILGPSKPPPSRMHAEEMATPFFENNRGLRGLLQATKNSWLSATTAAGAKPNLMAGPRMGAYGLRKISETFEEATRMGAYAKAVKRAKRGKKYTFTRALDEAMGGASGWAKMLYSSKHRAGFGDRWKAARHYSPEQMAAMSKNDRWIDPDMVDEIRNITLDFQQRGSRGETLNSFYPFFNAELQDVARFSRAMNEAPLTTMLRGFTFVSIPALANWYMNFDNPHYHELKEVERDLFIHPFGYNPEYKKFQRISRPLGSVSGFFGILPHKILDYFAANDPAAIKALEELLWPGRSAREARNALIETIHRTSDKLEDEVPAWARGMAYTAAMGNIPMSATGPVGERVEGGNPQLQGVPGGEYAASQFSDYLSTDTALRYIWPRDKSAAGWLTAPAPQVAAPLVEVLANKDPFFDRHIQSPSDLANPRLGIDHATEMTSPFEIMMQQGLGQMIQNLTPQQASHIFRRYTSSIGTMVMHGINKLGEESGVFDERPKTAKDFSEGFLPKAFHSREPFGSNSESVRQLYDTWEQDKRVINSLEFAKKNGKVRRLREIITDHPEFVPAMMLQESMGDMKEFYDMRDAIRTAPGISDEERGDYLFQIDQAMTTYAHEIMRVYWRLSRDPDLVFDLLDRD